MVCDCYNDVCASVTGVAVVNVTGVPSGSGSLRKLGVERVPPDSDGRSGKVYCVAVQGCFVYVFAAWRNAMYVYRLSDGLCSEQTSKHDGGSREPRHEIYT